MLGPARRLARKLLPIAIGALIVLTVRSSFADHYQVPTGSMEPTVQVGDRIFVAKAAYGLRLPLTDAWVARFDGPSRGDVVVLTSPKDDETLLKRVLGLPGETVAVRGGRVIVDGVPLTTEEVGGAVVERTGAASHALDLTDGGGPDWGPFTIPADRYLVLGDHRGNSEDGRYFGLVERDTILGRAVAVFVRDGGLTWEPL
ncbi:MAG: signal peptidase I [Deltaproteobacteria bacterium]|nr:MAG: signal peptidase I [Deltaproteobacteria bacterium]